MSRRLLLPLVITATFAACEDPNIVDPGTDEIPVPTAYEFDSRFQDGVSSVSYGGQTVRNLLVQDLKTMIERTGKAGATPVSTEDLRRIYEYSDAFDLTTLTDGGSAPAKETRYSAIATGKSVKNAPLPTEPVVGFGVTVDEMVSGWLQMVATFSSDPAKRGTPAAYTTPEGVDLSQMVEKVLNGAVAYQRGAGFYLVKVVDQANAAAEEGKPYTKMEHYWDEAFGYFGAARDFASYSDAELAGNVSQFTNDTNGDGRIDLGAEYNFAFAKSAGKRDKTVPEVDFTKTIFDAFLKGRTLIVNQGSTAEIAEQATIASQTWEKIIAATVIHYINETIEDMQAVTAAEVSARNNIALNKHWAEMKGYAVGLQFNPNRQLTAAQLHSLHQLMGSAPAYALPGTAAYDAAVQDLQDARTILKAAYGFTDAQVAAW